MCICLNDTIQRVCETHTSACIPCDARNKEE